MTTAPGILPFLLAYLRGESGFAVASMPRPVIDRAIESGLGPILARISRDSKQRRSAIIDEIEASDLTARVITGGRYDALKRILGDAAEAGCHPALLKGCSTAVRYYAEPHLRTMGDIDLLVRAEEAPALERVCTAAGFERSAPGVASSRYEHHHHGVPLRHPVSGIWVEIHTRLYSRKSPLATDARFSVDAIQNRMVPLSLDGQCAWVFNHELQLVYTCTRWAEYPNPQRGMFPVLDAARLLSNHGDMIDWDLVIGLAGRSWVATALRVMLGYLDRWKLADVPSVVMRRFAALDPYTNPLIVQTLHRFVTSFIMEGRPPGPFMTVRNARAMWTTLIAPSMPAAKIWKLPMNIVLPRGPRNRIDLRLAARRARSLAVRVARR
jgi:hypothetical protein